MHWVVAATTALRVANPMTAMDCGAVGGGEANWETLPAEKRRGLANPFLRQPRCEFLETAAPSPHLIRGGVKSAIRSGSYVALNPNDASVDETFFTIGSYSVVIGP